MRLICFIIAYFCFLILYLVLNHKLIASSKAFLIAPFFNPYFLVNNITKSFLNNAIYVCVQDKLDRDVEWDYSVEQLRAAAI